MTDPHPPDGAQDGDDGMTLLGEARTRVAAAAPSRMRRLIPYAALTVDVVMTSAAIVGGVVLRESLPIFGGSAEVSPHLLSIAPLIIVGWIAVTYLFGGYRSDIFGAGTEEFKRVVNAGLLTAGLVGVGCYLAKFSLSRGFFLLAFAVGIPGLLVGRYVLRKLIQNARTHGALHQGVLLVGSASHIDEIGAVLMRERWLGYRVLGAVTPLHDDRAETPMGIPVVGDVNEITRAVERTDADVLFFAGGAVASGSRMRQVVWELEKHDVQVVVAPSVSDVSSERIRIRPVGGLPLMHIDPPTWANAGRIGKRLFDLAGSALAILVLSPVFLLAVLAIKLDDRGPVLFRQQRVGRDGERFSCLKFRSMVVDAESRLADLHQEQGHESGLFKMENDPRITTPGRWLRRYSIDELPQLVNVLRGEMSLVGPRPPLPSEVEQYGEDTARRLHVRPGMTGLWQVSGRADLTWEEAIRLDLYYVDNWSMLQDLSILSKTVSAVFRSHGAY
jgi:exopolysaccharide biosynthesis polyprenyl glycosylphosphotransferase